MTREEAAKMLVAKYECMKREISCTDLDCIYRACAECDLCYEQGTSGEQIEALEMAIKALEHPEPCEDAERKGDELGDETASEIEKIKAKSDDYLIWLNSCGVIDLNTYNYVSDFYAKLLMKAYEQGRKDAQPERQNGEWIYYSPNGFKCSRCGGYLEIECGDVKMNFCPNCRADMRGDRQ